MVVCVQLRVFNHKKGIGRTFGLMQAQVPGSGESLSSYTAEHYLQSILALHCDTVPSVLFAQLGLFFCFSPLELLIPSIKMLLKLCLGVTAVVYLHALFCEKHL